MVRYLLILLCLLCITPSAAAAEYTIEHWMRTGTGYDQFHADAIPSFEKSNPGLKVRYTSLTTKESEEKFLLAMASDLVVDVIRTNPEVNLRLYAESGLLLPLDDLIRAANIDLRMYDPRALKISTFGGKLYALPYTLVPSPGLFYHTDLFDSAGLQYPTGQWTWENQFATAARKLTQVDSTGEVVRWGASVVPNYMNGFFAAGPLTPEMTRSSALSRENRAFLTFLKEMFIDYHALRTGSMNDLVKGTAAMRLAGYWEKAQLVSGAMESYAVAPPPAGPAGRELRWIIGSYSIPRTSADPVAAMRWLGHLTSREWAAEWVRRGLNPSSRHDANSLKEFQNDPVHRVWATFFNFEEAPFYWPDNLRYTEVDQAWQSAINRVITGQMAVETSLAQLDRELQVVLAKAKLIAAPTH